MTKEPAKVSKIIGPPGTGKTSEILRLIEAACDRYDPEKIGAVSYTKAAVNEMRDRIVDKSGLPKDTVRNVRTIHSHCFRLLEMKEGKVADEKLKDWNEAYPRWNMGTESSISEDEAYSQSAGMTVMDNRKRFNRIQILRNRMIPEPQWINECIREGWFDDTILEFWKDWKDWCFMNDYTDYTGMLERTLEEQLCPRIDVLFVDEAQDLTPLQIAIMRMWSEEVISTVYAGDSDQAIFRFAGSEPEAFMSLEHQWFRLLKQSYRVPKRVHEYAVSVIMQAKNREPVEYLPTEVEGQVLKNLPIPDLSLPGDHMIIGRCNYHLNRWRDFLISNGIAWCNPYRPGDKTWNPMDTKLWRSIRTYLKLKLGDRVPFVDVKLMIREMISKSNLKHGVKANIEDDMTDPKSEWEYFAMAASGYFTDEFLTFEKPISEVFKLSGQSGRLIERMKEPDIVNPKRVVLGTVHSVKGSEATHVWVDMGTSRQCAYGISKNPSIMYDEARVAYVAATRAKETLGLLSAQGIRNRMFV